MQATLSLEREMAVSGGTDFFCLVCEADLASTSSTNIFYSSLPRYGELLANFILRVLRPVACDFRSSYICARCRNLFEMLEQAHWNVANIRCEILKVYRSRESNGILERKQELGNNQILPHDDIFIGEADGKNNAENHFVDIEGLRTLSVGRNEFDALNIDINSLETSMTDKKDIEGSLEICDPDDCKIEANLVRATTLENEKLEDVTENVHKINDTDEVQNCVASMGAIPNELLCDSAPKETDNCREIISRISDELQKDPLRENQDNTQDTFVDNTNCTVRNFVPAEEKNPPYNFQCSFCSRLFRSSSELQNHCLKHGGSRPYRCLECSQRFAEFSEANEHSCALHSSTKNCISVATEPMDNEIVDFSEEDWILPDEFRRNESKDSALSTEDDEAKRKQINEPPSWKSGRIAKYSQKPLKYTCSTCGKKWRTSADLKTHVKSHSNLRPYMCEKCGQAYKHKHALEIHVGMHNGISPFQCSFCNKCFTQKGALMRHLPMHTGETPYQCELCGKRFVHHTSYNMHALSHTGKKSYQCHVCDLSLLSTSHLKRHLRVHTGEKPYSCALCGKSFAERYNLFAHQKIHDPVEIMAKAAKKMTYKCEQCDEFFDKKQKLDDHTKDHRSCTSRNSTTNGRKWIGHTVEVVPPVRGNDSLIEQSWQDLDNAKLHSAGLKSAQNDNQLSQLSHESIAMLVSQTNYNKGMVFDPTTANVNTEIIEHKYGKSTDRS